MPSFRESFQPRDWTQVSHIAGRFFTIWGTREAQEHWNRLPCPPPGDLPNPGIEPRSPALQVDSLPSEPPGKLMNTGVGSLPLLQGIFLIQESNLCLLHCRHILYQLNYQGSPPTSLPTPKYGKIYSSITTADRNQCYHCVLINLAWFGQQFHDWP